jgi:hypothetical protein
MESDLTYYRRRSVEEAAAAAASLDPKVRAIHLELAERYEVRIAALAAEGSRVHIHLVSAA